MTRSGAVFWQHFLDRCPLARWFLCGLGLFTAFPAICEAALIRLSFEELTQKSTLIVTGEVVATRCYEDSFKGIGRCLFTDVTLRVGSTLKGKLEKRDVTIQVLGGRVGKRWEVCAESPTYRKGEQVLVFLRKFNGKWWNTGWLQGKYPLVRKSAPSTAISVYGKIGRPIGADVPLTTVRDQVLLFSTYSASKQVELRVPPAPSEAKSPRRARRSTEKSKR